MQRTISFEHKGKKYISKPFDLGCVAVMMDARLSAGGADANITALSHCVKADILNYMFDGTEATADIIKEVPLYEQIRMCNEVYDIYADSFRKPEKAKA